MQPTEPRSPSPEPRGCIYCLSHPRLKNRKATQSAEKANRASREVLENAEFIPASPKGSFAPDGTFRPSPLATPVLAPHIGPEWQPMPILSDILRANEAKEEAERLKQPQTFAFKDEHVYPKENNLDKIIQEKPESSK